MVNFQMTRLAAELLKGELIAITASSVHIRPQVALLIQALDDGLKNKEDPKHATQTGNNPKS